jgi:putative SOS response-associated peptidase YedK
MCGRYTHLFTWKQLHRLMTLTSGPIEFKERFNVAPTQDAPVVLSSSSGSREAAMLRWGLVPHWAKDLAVGASMINARAEGIESKPAFRDAIRRRRCIVPVSGFYEWKKPADGQPKQAYYIRPTGEGDVLAFAGLWESWGGGGDQPAVRTFTVITTTPNALMRSLHDRMPVILAPADIDRWLNPAIEDPARVLDLLRPAPEDALVCWPVSSRVNSPRNDEPACIRPVDPPAAGLFG